jgi:predicted nucleic acid-binding protein
MKQLLIDTNIVLDLLARRTPFYDEAAGLFSLADKKIVLLSISAMSLANTHYVLSRFKSQLEAGKILRDFKVLVQVLPYDNKIADLAINSDFMDFEDAIQYYTAIENGQDLIITRDHSGFRKSTIPVMSAGEFIRSLAG